MLLYADTIFPTITRLGFIVDNLTISHVGVYAAESCILIAVEGVEGCFLLKQGSVKSVFLYSCSLYLKIFHSCIPVIRKIETLVWFMGLMISNNNLL